MRMEALSIPSDNTMGFSECGGSPQYSSIDYAPDYHSYSPALPEEYETADSVSSYDTRKDSTSSYDRKDSSSSSLFEDHYTRTPSYSSDASDVVLHEDLAGSLSNMSISSADSGVCDTGLPYTASSIDTSCHISSPYSNNSGIYDTTQQPMYSNSGCDSNTLRSPVNKSSSRQRKSACRGAAKGAASEGVPRRSSAPARQGDDSSARKDSRVYDVQLESDNVLLFVPDLDLVKSHLMYAVRAEVDVLKEEIGELYQYINRVEYENSVLRQYAPQEALQIVGPQPPPRRAPHHGKE